MLLWNQRILVFETFLANDLRTMRSVLRSAMDHIFVLQTVIAQKGVNDILRAIDALIDSSVASFFMIVSHNFALLL